MPRVLYLDHPEHDYLSALLYMGLCEELGPENVIDWPPKATFHGKVYRGPVPCHAPDFLGMSEPLPWSVPQPEHGLTELDVLRTDFDLVVLASPRQYNADALERLRSTGWLPRRFVMVDGEDYTTIRWDYVERFRPSVYFKTSSVAVPFESYPEAKARMAGTVRIVPFPMSTTTGGMVPARDKDIDVAFLGGNNWRPGRVEGRDPTPLGKAALDECLRGLFPSYVGGNVEPQEYTKVLAKSRVAVSVGGSGTEPLRTYEILSCPETLLMRERLPGIAHRPLVEDVTHIGWSTSREPPFDFTEIVRKIRWALDNPAQRTAIARTGNAFCMAHYTPRARARHLLEEAL